MSLTAPYHGDAGMMQGNKRVLLGIGVSVAVHVLLMFAYRHSGPFPPPIAPEPPSSITVRIAPPPPPEPSRVAPSSPRRSEAAAPRGAPRPAPKPVIAVPPSPRQEPSSDPFVVQQADGQAEAGADTPAPNDTPQFDMNAAKQTARQLAGQTKLGREGMANAQFPDPPLETESKLAKDIRKAKRRHCKDGLPGGLLAPLFLALEKKDHGCKW